MNNCQQIKRITTILLLLIFCSDCFAQQSANKIATEDELKENLKAVPCINSDRLEAVKKLYQKMGASDSDIFIDKFGNIQNLVVTKKGKTDETIIVGAHYDKVSDGCGAIDNWSGIVIVANLFKTIKNFPTEKTYKFVAFDKEEEGLLGSNEMANAIPKEKRIKYCSMINLDSFGFNYPQVLTNTSNSKMTVFAKNLAKELKMPFTEASLFGTADADSTSFLDKDIPAITFHGLSNDWQKYLHTSKDKLENINTGSVLVGYQFILQYLTKLDSSNCTVFRKQNK